MIVRRLTCPACGRTWTVMAGDVNVACPGCGSAGTAAETEGTEAATRTCRYEPCSKAFVPNHPWQEFCEPTCRTNQHYVDHPEKGRVLRDGALRSVAGAIGGDNREPTDCERLLIALRVRGEAGIHSHEVRKLGISGNPSQRITELENQGCTIQKVREHKGRRPGTRYMLMSEGVPADVGTLDGAAGDPAEPTMLPGTEPTSYERIQDAA